jgi:hypothetical protein
LNGFDIIKNYTYLQTLHVNFLFCNFWHLRSIMIKHIVLCFPCGQLFQIYCLDYAMVQIWLHSNMIFTILIFFWNFWDKGLIISKNWQNKKNSNNVEATPCTMIFIIFISNLSTCVTMMDWKHLYINVLNTFSTLT